MFQGHEVGHEFGQTWQTNSPARSKFNVRGRDFRSSVLISPWVYEWPLLCRQTSSNLSRLQLRSTSTGAWGLIILLRASPRSQDTGGQNLEILKSWKCPIRNLEILKSWNLEILNLESWRIKISRFRSAQKSWNLEILKSWNLEILRQNGNLEILKSWNLENPVKISRFPKTLNLEILKCRQDFKIRKMAKSWNLEILKISSRFQDFRKRRNLEILKRKML